MLDLGEFQPFAIIFSAIRSAISSKTYLKEQFSNKIPVANVSTLIYYHNMIGLIVLIIFGIGVGLFSTQNTQSASITFAQYTFSNIPMYLIILVAILSGIFVSWVISLAGFVSSFFTMHGKENKIKEGKKNAADLTKRVHELELENERLKAENNQNNKDDKSL